MKTITKERILKALDKVSKYTDAKPEIHIITTLASIGLRSACNEAFGDNSNPVTEKDRLELAYQGFTDPEKILRRLSQWKVQDNISSIEAIKEAWQSSFLRTLEKGWARQERITSIQQKYKVSGIEEVEVDFGGFKVKHHRPMWGLAILDEDWFVIQTERIRVARAFVDAAESHGLTLHRRVKLANHDDWIEVDRQSVMVWVINSSFWVKIWQHSSHKSGNLNYEFHLCAGRSEDPDTDLESAWFCARIGKPSL